MTKWANPEIQNDNLLRPSRVFGRGNMEIKKIRKHLLPSFFNNCNILTFTLFTYLIIFINNIYKLNITSGKIKKGCAKKALRVALFDSNPFNSSLSLFK